MPTIDLVYFDAGSGHRAAATALSELAAVQGRPWTVRRVHLTRVLDPDDAFRARMGMAPEDLYNRRLARGWTLGLGVELRLLQGLIAVARPVLVRRLAAHWRATRPDLVVSLVPNFNRVLRESLALARPGVPFVTVLTDLADLPPRFWIERGLDQHLICGSDRAVEQARDAGHPPDRIRRVSGMILREAFHRPPVHDGRADLIELGLDPQQPVCVVMFGGQGSMQMHRIAKQLDHVQLLLLCGHNTALRDALRAMRRSAPHAALGFTPDVPRWMRLGDVFVGKPGPGALSEALQCGLPVVTFRNAWTLPQERFNTRWVEALGVGRVIASPRGLAEAVDAVLADIVPMRRRVAALENRAVFEVLDALDDLLRPAPAARVFRPDLEELPA